MPSFQNLSEEDLLCVVAFLNTKDAPDPKASKFDPNALINPIPEPIPSSGLTIGLELITTIPPSSKEGQLTRICKLDFRPDTKGLFVVDLRGKLYEIENNESKLYLDMVKEKPKFIDKPDSLQVSEVLHFTPSSIQMGCCTPRMLKALDPVRQISITMIQLKLLCSGYYRNGKQKIQMLFRSREKAGSFSAQTWSDLFTAYKKLRLTLWLSGEMRIMACFI